MDQLPNQAESAQESAGQTLGRRELLKAVIASGGAIAAVSLTPGRWVKPVIEVGMLPAHAQISVPPIVEPTEEPPQLTLRASANEETFCQAQIWTVTNITANVIPTTAGVEIRMEGFVGDTRVVGPVSAVTNASGVASFPDVPQTWDGFEDLTLRFSLVNPQYGPATATLGPYVVGC